MHKNPDSNKCMHSQFYPKKIYMTPRGPIQKAQMLIEEFLPFSHPFIYVALESTQGITVKICVNFTKKQSKKVKENSDDETRKSCLPDLTEVPLSQQIVERNR